MTFKSPPRCVAGFTASPTDQPAAEIGSLDGQNYFWSLGCRCSGRSFVVRSVFGPHFYLKHPVTSGPITLRCVTCAREDTCFVPSQHGFDAELDFSPPPEEDDDAELRDSACPRCGATSFRVIARFEYPATIRAGQSPESSGPEEEDLFTYFMLIVTCDSCRLISLIADVQCA